MKTLALMLVIALHSFSLVGQTMKFEEASKTTEATSPLPTKHLVIEDSTFMVHETSKGGYKLLRTSKSGNDYWQYLGYETTESYEGKTVWTNAKQTEYYYYVVGRTGYPSKRKLVITP